MVPLIATSFLGDCVGGVTLTISGVANKGWIPYQLRLDLAFLRYRFVVFKKQGIMSPEEIIGPMLEYGRT